MGKYLCCNVQTVHFDADRDEDFKCVDVASISMVAKKDGDWLLKKHPHRTNSQQLLVSHFVTLHYPMISLVLESVLFVGMQKSCSDT